MGLNAHRVAWEIANGRKLVAGEQVCHHCDNPCCCNPEHLFAGTRSDNMRDMLAKGRQGYTGSPGEKHPSAVLTEEKVRAIRAEATEATQRAIAKKYGVTRSLIGQIVRRKAWAHVT